MKRAEVLRDQKLRSYSLNSVSAHFLGEQKEDGFVTSLFRLAAESVN